MTTENEQLLALLQSHHDKYTRHSRARQAADSTCAEALRDPLGGLIESGYLQSQLGKDTVAALAQATSPATYSAAEHTPARQCAACEGFCLAAASIDKATTALAVAATRQERLAALEALASAAKTEARRLRATGQQGGDK